jgi:hypothetical protein
MRYTVGFGMMAEMCMSTDMGMPCAAPGRCGLL